MNHPSDLAWTIALGVVLPIVLGRYVAKASWIITGVAFITWLAIFYRFLAKGWTFQPDIAEWMIGFCVWSNWLAVPLIALIGRGCMGAMRSIRAN